MGRHRTSTAACANGLRQRLVQSLGQRRHGAAVTGPAVPLPCYTSMDCSGLLLAGKHSTDS